MIRVNLLPEDRRPAERTPLPRLLIIFFGVFIMGLEVVGLIYYYGLAIPNANAYLDSIEKNIPKYKAEAQLVEKDRNEIEKLKVRMDAVRDLVKGRRTWAIIFERLRDVTPEAIWIRSFGFKKGRSADGGIVIELEASAAGPNPRKMLDEITAFMRSIERDRKLKNELVETEPVALGPLKVTTVSPDETDPKRPRNVMTFTLYINLRAPGVTSNGPQQNK